MNLVKLYESKIYTADFTHDFDTAQLRAILNSHEQNVAWVIDCDYNSNTSCFAGEVNDFENLSLELKLVSTGGGSLNWALVDIGRKQKDILHRKLYLQVLKILLLIQLIDMLHMIRL